MGSQRVGHDRANELNCKFMIATVNDVRFMISEEEYLALEPGTRLNHSRAFVWQSFIKLRKGTEKALT